MYQNRMRALLVTLASHVVIITLVLMLGRYFMLHHFAVPEELTKYSDDVVKMWSIGLRYDLRIAGMFMAPFFLMGLILCSHSLTWRLLQIASPFLLGLIVFTVIMVTISNFYYYQTYHNHFDVFAFGLADDDTASVLLTVWQDYPVVTGLLCAMVGAFMTYRIATHTLRDQAHKRWPLSAFIVYVLVAFIVLSLASRGSAGTFPLRRGNAQVSELLVLNKLSPNGFMALDWALKDKKMDASFEPVSRATGKKLEAVMGIESITARTPENAWLATNPPNVVVSVMESFGSNMLAFDDANTNDLLGSLRGHFAKDFVFTRFLSEDNGTAPSLAALLFHSPFENISHSSEQKIVLQGVPFDVYKKSGYKTVFISPGNMAWRNLSNYLPLQHVDAVYDQNSLMSLYPESVAELGAWGVPDDYAYRLAEQILKDSQEPIFITILTITNHPPYDTPSRYKAFPYAVTPDVAEHAQDDANDTQNLLRTYQFAADALGQFVSHIEASDVGSRTIIAATGDHQMRRVKASYPQEQVLDRAVPFYLHIPNEILANTPWTYDPTRVGSHKDIFPTLYHFSLSDAYYHALAGRNMLAPVDDEHRAFGYNVSLWIDKHGAYPMSGKVAFYPWEGADGLRTDNDSAVPVEQQQARQKALPELLRWQLNSQLRGFTD